MGREEPVHVDDALASSLRVSWREYFDSKGFQPLDLGKLREDVLGTWKLVQDGLKDIFEGLRKNGDYSALTVPWVNAHMVYGRRDESDLEKARLWKILGVRHEGGHGEYFMETPVEKMEYLSVYFSLLGLKFADEAFFPRVLLERLLSYERDSVLQEFYATELVERSTVEEWSKHVYKRFREVGSKRISELVEATNYGSIRQIPDKCYYRYVVARRLREAC